MYWLMLSHTQTQTEKNWINENMGKSMNEWFQMKTEKLKPNKIHKKKPTNIDGKKIRNENLSWAEMWFEYKLSVHDFVFHSLL